MPKDIPVSNGNLLFNFDSDYQIRDVYFPLIGQENHSKGNPFRFGVWVDGRCSWMGPEWKKNLRYHHNTLATNVFLKNESLGLELCCSDVVDIDLNVYIKKIEVTNLNEKERQVRLFFSHDFHLYGNDIGDTAYFDPRTRSIVHYKANRYFLIGCSAAEKYGVDYYACGDKEVPGREGTWKDAEDGELSGNDISWGSADSTIGIWLQLPSGGKAEAFYWVAAGTHYNEVAQLNHEVIEKTPIALIKRTSNYWEAWVQKESRSFGDLPKTVTEIFNRSLLILRTQIDNRGAIIAANDSDIVRFGKDTYSYMWGRDGAFAAAALAKAGYAHVCMKFFDFCARVLSEEGYLYQHYNPDGSLASNWHPWLVDGKAVLPIQEDSTALILWALWIHYECSKDIEFIRPLYDKLIKKSADFLVTNRDHDTKLPIPSYDLWEERFGVHSFTVAAVIAGLRAAANFARLFKDASLAEKYDNVAEQMKEGLERHLYHTGLKRYARSGYRKDKGYELDEVIDVSLLGLTILGALPPRDPRMVETMEAIHRQLWLKTPVEGCARYQNDVYQRPSDSPADIPGNPWFISTLWLGDYFIARAESLQELREAIPYLEWCGRNALPSGVLAEQVHPINSSPLSVSPLTWSHSAFVWTGLQYIGKFNSLKNNNGV
ncbi:MAG: glycoside hydrolase family 15 [Nitrospirae bacterium CG_4_10_14_0_8_um_filter_41_23]|nr:MAG: glycoside hydrolase family 15 [Nitrospirae bacterium CG02_land_8_20_14_3_00_41_53]PIY86705.1 MAG: glycoside hydrolase family 15 [Nitrospirae bacterium CG_4_10_14_0_8_um_filter_41_23]